MASITTTTTRSALISLLHDLLALDSVQFRTESPGPIDTPTKTLMMRAAQYESTTILQLVEINLHILLSQYPFKITHTDLSSYQQRFFMLWTGKHEDDAALGRYPAHGKGKEKEDNGPLTAATGLSFLTAIRPNFHRLGDSGFRFVSELLLYCIQTLSLEGTGGHGNIREWVDVHGTAVTVLSELLYSIPVTGWAGLDELAECTFPIWQCLLLLTTGANWWRVESEQYRQNTLRLAKSLLKLPNCSSLLKGLLRVDMRPADVHNIITAVLQPLERQFGIETPEYINAFTPAPFNFPNAAALDKHDFSKEYEFSNLRVMFVTWINSDPMARRMSEFRAPWNIEVVLQHTEAYRRLKAHPESAIRVALIYIFNQVQRGFLDFKPCSDAKVIELLHDYISYVSLLPRVSKSKTPKATARDALELGPQSFVAANAEWVIPWLWKRRATDSTFVMAMTATWLETTCTGEWSETHVVFKIISEHAETAFSVFHDFFSEVFNSGFISNADNPLKIGAQMQKVLLIVLKVILLIKKDKPALLTQQLAMLIIRCFVAAGETEWIPIEAWWRCRNVLVCFPRNKLSSATKLAQVVAGINDMVPLFLRDMEAICTICGKNQAAGMPLEKLEEHIETLTAMIQFSTLLARSHEAICTALATRFDLEMAARQYIVACYSPLLTSRLSALHSASVGALVELLVVTGVGLNRLGRRILEESTDVLEAKNNMIGTMIKALMSKPYVTAYVLPGMCGLVTLISDYGWWGRDPFLYTAIWDRLRQTLLLPDTHKWCLFLPAFTAALSSLLKAITPSLTSRPFLASTNHPHILGEMLLSNRWNFILTVKFLKFLLETEHTQHCTTCGVPLFIPISGFLRLVLSHHPPWQRDLHLSQGMGKHAVLEWDGVEKRVRELAEQGRKWDADALMTVVECFEYPKKKMLRVWLMRELKAGGPEKEDMVRFRGRYAQFKLNDDAGVLVVV